MRLPARARWPLCWLHADGSQRNAFQWPHRHRCAHRIRAHYRARRPTAGARRRRGDRGRWLALEPALRRSALSHGRNAELRAAARQPERHAARRHRVVGRVEAAAGAGRARRTGLAILRLGRRQRAARDPLARRRVRRALAGGRSAAAREAGDRALPRPATCRVPARRPAAVVDRAGEPEARAGDGRRRGRRHPALRANHGRRRSRT